MITLKIYSMVLLPASISSAFYLSLFKMTRSMILLGSQSLAKSNHNIPVCEPTNKDKNKGSFAKLRISVSSLTGVHRTELAPLIQWYTTQGWHQSYRYAPLRVDTSVTGVHHTGLAPLLQVYTTQGWHHSYSYTPLRVRTSLTGVHHSGFAPVLQVCTTHGWQQSDRCAPLMVDTSITGVHHSGLALVLQVCTTQG